MMKLITTTKEFLENANAEMAVVKFGNITGEEAQTKKLELAELITADSQRGYKSHS